MLMQLQFDQAQGLCIPDWEAIIERLLHVHVGCLGVDLLLRS